MWDVDIDIDIGMSIRIFMVYIQHAKATKVQGAVAPWCKAIFIFAV